MSVADFDPFTLMVSLIGSLAVSYIGVRYFTGAKIRAERADIARRDMRAAVAPWLRSARTRANRRRVRPSRDARSRVVEDGLDALTVLRIARDLPLWRRALVRRRCRIIFGDYWSDLAERQVDMSADERDDANQLSADALFGHMLRDDDAPAGKQRIGLMQRVYSSNVEGEAARLVTHLSRLIESR